MDIEVAFPNIAFPRMVFLTHAGDNTDRLFLVLQPGRVMVFPDEAEADSVHVFLDIRERVNDKGNEEGLLGLAFGPDGFLYIGFVCAWTSPISGSKVGNHFPTFT